MRIEYNDKGEGNRGQLQVRNWKKSGFREKCHDLNFGHAELKMILRYSNGNFEGDWMHKTAVQKKDLV